MLKQNSQGKEKKAAIIFSKGDYEGLMETLDILSNQKLVKGINKAWQDFKKGKSIPWDKAKKQLGYV